MTFPEKNPKWISLRWISGKKKKDIEFSLCLSTSTITIIASGPACIWCSCYQGRFYSSIIFFPSSVHFIIFIFILSDLNSIEVNLPFILLYFLLYFYKKTTLDYNVITTISVEASSNKNMFSLEYMLNIWINGVMNGWIKERMYWWLDEWIAAWQTGVVRKPLLMNWNPFLTRMHPIQPPGSLLCARSQPQVVQALCVIFLNAFSSASTYACSWCEQPHPLAVIICFRTCCFSTCQVDQHYCTCIKWIISTWRSHFLLLKWVYYGFIFHCLSSRCCLLSEEFSALPSHSHWVDCQMLRCAAELLMNAREVSESASARGKEIKVLLRLAGQGVAVASKWKNANKYRTDADKFQLLWKQLDAVERASDLEPDRPGLKSQMCHFQSLWIELFASSLNYRFLHPNHGVAVCTMSMAYNRLSINISWSTIFLITANLNGCTKPFFNHLVC